KLQRQLPAVRRNVEAAVERLDRFIVPLHDEKQVTELVERRRIRRPALDGTLELEERLVLPAELAQRNRKLGVEDRIVTAARRFSQGADGVLGLPLHQQRSAEDLQGARVTRVVLDPLAGEPRRFNRPLA